MFGVATALQAQLNVTSGSSVFFTKKRHSSLNQPINQWIVYATKHSICIIKHEDRTRFLSRSRWSKIASAHMCGFVLFCWFFAREKNVLCYLIMTRWLTYRRVTCHSGNPIPIEWLCINSSTHCVQPILSRRRVVELMSCLHDFLNFKVSQILLWQKCKNS